MDVTWRDADPAAAMRILALARSNDAWTVRPDEPRTPPLHRSLYLDHIVRRNAFGDAHDQIQASVHSFEDRVGGKCRRHENCRSRRAGLFGSFGHGIENRNFVLEALVAFARRYS